MNGRPAGLASHPDPILADLLTGQGQTVLDVVAQEEDLGESGAALAVLRRFYLDVLPAERWEPMPCYWAAYLAAHQLLGGPATDELVTTCLRQARAQSAGGVFPFRLETVSALRWALQRDPRDGHAALYLGHVLFALGRHAEGREYWEQAAALGVEPAVAYRALGMACLRLDANPSGARQLLARAQQADPADPIVARDLARVEFQLAEAEPSPAKQTELIRRAQRVLEGAFAAGKGRADLVALLARARNRLGDYAASARLLDAVRVTIWEGAQDLHALFVQAHVALGKAALQAGNPTEALAQFNRALEYPANLATGRLEGAREGRLQYLRGQALAALAQAAAAVEAWRKAADAPASQDAEEEAARREAKAALRRAQAQ